MRQTLRTRQQLRRTRALAGKRRSPPSRFLTFVRSLAAELGFHRATKR